MPANQFHIQFLWIQKIDRAKSDARHANRTIIIRKQ